MSLDVIGSTSPSQKPSVKVRLLSAFLCLLARIAQPGNWELGVATDADGGCRSVRAMPPHLFLFLSGCGMPQPQETSLANCKKGHKKRRKPENRGRTKSLSLAATFDK